MEGLFAPTNRATERTLTINDYRLVDAPKQRCCGALHAHAGDLETARRLARANVAAFERAKPEFVVTNAAGCGPMMKEYGHLLKDDVAWAERAARVSAKVRDVSELLVAAGPKAPAAAVPATVTYDAPCHLLPTSISAQPCRLGRVLPASRWSDDRLRSCCGAAALQSHRPETPDAVCVRRFRNMRQQRRSMCERESGC